MRLKRIFYHEKNRKNRRLWSSNLVLGYVIGVCDHGSIVQIKMHKTDLHSD